MTLAERAQLEKPPADGGFRLDGRVAVGRIVYDQTVPQRAFPMSDGPAVGGVGYPGRLPAAFGVGREVVVEGTYIPARRTRHAAKLVTTCPSKYEAEGLGKDKT